MASLNEVPVQRDPKTKDAWCYLAGPIAVAEMIELEIMWPQAKDQPFHALGEPILLRLNALKLLPKWLKSGDVVMLRTEKTDG